MPLMRLVGIFLMSAAPVAAGAYAAIFYRRGVRQIEDFILLIEDIRTKIRYYRMPLHEIYSGMDLHSLSSFCRDLASEGFARALEENKGSFAFSQDCFDKLAVFSRELGKSGSETQIQNCDMILDVLKKERDVLNAELPKRSKVSITLGAMSGILLFVLLL